MAFTAITAGQVDAESPIDTTLMGTVRTNFDDHETRVLAIETSGATPTDGSVTPAKLSAQTAGDYLLSSNDTDRTTTSPSPTYIKLKEIKIAKSGTYRIKFDLRETAGGTASYGKIYKNGSAVGTERSSSANTTFSEDISGWAAGDLIQVYGHIGASGTCGIQNLRIYGSTPGDFGTNPSY